MFRPSTRRVPDPLWVVRGVAGGEDVELVVEARDAIAAECFATKRAVEVVLVAAATDPDIEAARLAGRLWRYTPVTGLRCFGRAVGHLQAAALVICGLVTIILNLRAHHVPLRLWW